MRVAVALSGGVDSAVAAARLIRQGCDVSGVTLYLGRSGCQSRLGQPAHERAALIARRLGIVLLTLDLSDAFESQIMSYFRQEYLAGRTPNPCVLCNPRIKVRALAAALRERGVAFEKISTGHYAKVEERTKGDRKKYALLQARDRARDQSYFLYRLNQEDLSRILFPLGDAQRDEVEEEARALGFPVLPGSQDFISAKEDPVLAERESPGEIVDTSGRVLGHHRGIQFFTVGQRRGLGIAAGKPLYVVRIEPEHKRVVVGPESELYCRRVRASQVNWIDGSGPARPLPGVMVKIRYRHEPARAMVWSEGQYLTIEFEEPQRAVTPGQSAVVYDADRVLGGGIIEGCEDPG